MIVSKGISPEYFLDEMSQSEISAIIQAHFERFKLSWEQVRTLSFYTMIAEHGTKHIKSPEALFKFSWDSIKKQSNKRDRPLEDYKKFADNLIQNGK